MLYPDNSCNRNVKEEYRFCSLILSIIDCTILLLPTRTTQSFARVIAVYKRFRFIKRPGPDNNGSTTAGYSLPCDL